MGIINAVTKTYSQFMSEALIGGIFVYCLLPGVISLTIFEKRGKNGFKGFLLGVLLSYLGVAIALFLPSNKQTLKGRINKKIEDRKKTIGLIRGTMKSCTNCGEVVEMDLFVCPHCKKYA